MNSANTPGRAEHSRDSRPAGGGTVLAGGHLLAAISTNIVGILRDHYGRGPMKAKTYALDDIVVVVMRGSGFTPLEQTIMDSGEPDRVIAMREDFQRVMASRYKHAIEELTGRKVSPSSARRMSSRISPWRSSSSTAHSRALDRSNTV